MSEGSCVNKGLLETVETLGKHTKLLECLRKPEITQVILVEDWTSTQGTGQPSAGAPRARAQPAAKTTSPIKVVTTTSAGFIKLYTMNRQAPSSGSEPAFALSKSYMIHSSGITAACQV